MGLKEKFKTLSKRDYIIITISGIGAYLFISFVIIPFIIFMGDIDTVYDHPELLTKFNEGYTEVCLSYYVILKQTQSSCLIRVNDYELESTDDLYTFKSKFQCEYWQLANGEIFDGKEEGNYGCEYKEEGYSHSYHKNYWVLIGTSGIKNDFKGEYVLMVSER